MESLPDDALLAVFSFLDIRSLLRCRVVCRHWRDLVQHRDVWIKRTIHASLLHLSPPCCDTLDLEKGFTWTDFGLLAATVPCAATNLLIDCIQSASNVALVSLVIRHQINLGRLRTLSIYFKKTGACDVDYQDLCYDKLAELLKNSSPCYLTIKCDTMHSAVDYMLEMIPHEVCCFEMVHQGVVCWSGDFPPVEQLPRLRRLICPLSPALDCLKSCPWLRELEILLPDRKLDEFEEEVLDESFAVALSVFHTATWLRHVSLVSRGCYDNLREQTRGLIRKLGDSGQSQLTHLEVQIEGSTRMEIWDDVLAVVPKLLYLQDLYYFGIVALEDLYKFVQVATSVTTLIVSGIADCICCKWTEVCNLLKTRPDMQLIIMWVSYKECLVNCKSHFSRDSLLKLTYRNAAFASKHTAN